MGRKIHTYVPDYDSARREGLTWGSVPCLVCKKQAFVNDEHWVSEKETDSVSTRAETGYEEDVHLAQRGRRVPERDYVECDICRQPTTTFHPLSGKTSTLACKRCAEEWWEAYGD